MQQLQTNFIEFCAQGGKKDNTNKGQKRLQFPTQYKRMTLTEDQKECLTKQICNFVTSSLLPFRVVDNPHFKEIFSTLLSNYNTLCRQTLVKKYDEMSGIQKEKLKKILKDVSYVCAQTDIWTSKQNKEYMNFILTYLDNNFDLKYALLGCYYIGDEMHDSKWLQQKFEEIIDDYELQGKIVAFVIDRASYYVSLFKNQGIDHVPCSAHLINQILVSSINVNKYDKPDEIQLIQSFNNELNGAKEIIKKMRNKDFRRKYYEACKDLEISGKTLVKHNETRWNSLYSSIKVFLNQLDAIQKVENVSSSIQNSYALYIELFEPFQTVFQKIQKRSFDISTCIPIVNQLRNKFKQIQSQMLQGGNNLGAVVSSKVPNLLEKLFKNIAKKDCIQLSYGLNVIYKQKALGNEYQYQNIRVNFTQSHFGAIFILWDSQGGESKIYSLRAIRFNSLQNDRCILLHLQSFILV